MDIFFHGVIAPTKNLEYYGKKREHQTFPSLRRIDQLYDRGGEHLDGRWFFCHATLFPMNHSHDNYNQSNGDLHCLLRTLPPTASRPFHGGTNMTVVNGT